MRASLGQHFLRSPSALRALTRAIPLSRETFVVEVGPGKGALTAYLLRTEAAVLAIERDRQLATSLQERFADSIANDRLRVIVGDIRDTSWLTQVPKSYVIVANIPYYLTSSLLRQVLSSDQQPQACAVMVQKEIAERIIARDGKESLLSLSVRLFGEPKMLQTVPKTAFSPQPSVSSAILTITAIHPQPQALQEAFFAIITRAFQEKRKQVRKKFAHSAVVTELLDKQGVTATDRAEDIPFAVWYALAEHMSEYPDGAVVPYKR